MAKIDSFKHLTVWQKAMELAENGFRLTATLPRDFRFELTSQIHRAAISIPSEHRRRLQPTCTTRLS